MEREDKAIAFIQRADKAGNVGRKRKLQNENRVLTTIWVYGENKVNILSN